MTDVGMGGNLPKALQTNKVNENAQVDRKEAIKNREAMAGAKQVEGKLKKEDIKRTSERYKAFKSAYQYLLGEEPEDEIEEEMESAPLEEEEELKKQEKVKPNLQEIEEYKVRDRFKAKLGLMLGDDFDEDAPLDNEEDLTPEEKNEDTKSRLELAKDAFASLSQYITDSLGKFDFDNSNDLKLFIQYGMPEDAIIKFIMLQQLARSDSEFPNIMDMSVLMDKLKKLQILLSPDNVHEIISNDFGTAKRVKYTVSGFIYVPLLEVMNKIEEDMKIDFQNIFNRIINEFGYSGIDNFSERIPDEIIQSFRNSINFHYNKINELSRNKEVLQQGLNTIQLKSKESTLEKIKIIDNELINHRNTLSELEMNITKAFFIYNFLNSGLSISEYNKNYPYNSINQSLNSIGVNYKASDIKLFINEKVNIHSLKIKQKNQKEEQKKNTELSESKIKNAIIAISKQPPPKQQQMLKNIRVNSFELSSNFYWLKQKKLSEVIDISENLSDLFNG